MGGWGGGAGGGGEEASGPIWSSLRRYRSDTVNSKSFIGKIFPSNEMEIQITTRCYRYIHRCLMKS